MADRSQMAGSQGSHGSNLMVSVWALASDFADFLTNGASKAGRIAKAGIHAIQVGRMQSVLSQMSDDQLAVVGISRDEIPAHAALLIDMDPEH